MATESSEEVVSALSYIVPVIGGITATLISIAPWKAVKTVNEFQSLGELNPFPFPLMMANGLGWLIYSLMIRDWFIFIPNIISYTLGVYYTFMTLRFTTLQFQMRTMYITILSSILVFFSSAIGFIVLKEEEPAATILGFACVIILTVFYSSPLSSLYTVVKTKSAKSIDLRFACTCLVNGLVWTTYGLTLNNIVF